VTSEELSAEARLARGIEEYLKRRFEEAADHFEKAISTDSRFVQAFLALGATRLTLYQKRPSPAASYIRAAREISKQELAAYQEKENAILAEQNASNWPLAENALKRANQLEPKNLLIVEYLCVLYFSWKDPLDEASDRMDEAKRWLERLVELNPEHKYANFYCGLILCSKARKLMPSYGRFPRSPEPDLASLRIKVGALLEEASRHLAHALAVGGEHTAASHFVDEVTSMQAYLADPDKAARDLRDKLTESFHRSKAAAAERQAAGNPSSPDQSA
jgi:tetratricopeptide (TPR) repeat protein